MKYNKVQSVINSILFEDAYSVRSTEDHKAGKQAAVTAKTVPKELPVSPDENVSLNSVVTRPPVEDDDYVPKTPSELSAAVKALSELLRSDEVAKVYAQIKDIVRDSGKVTDSRVNEAYDDDDGFELPDDSDMPEEFRTGYSIEEEPDEEPEKFQPSKSSGEASLDDLVKTGLMPGVSGESGAKQWLGRAGKKMAALQMFDKDQIDQVKNFARDIWVGALEATKSIKPDEAEALRKSSYTLTNPAFLSFLNMGFLEPAIKPVKVQRDREVKKEMAALDLPPQIENMVFSQTVGLSPQSHRKIRMKLNREFPDMNLQEMDDLVKKAKSFINSSSEKYQKEFFASVDFLKAAKDAWNKKSTDEKMDITFAAIDESESFQKQAKKVGLR